MGRETPSNYPAPSKAIDTGRPNTSVDGARSAFNRVVANGLRTKGNSNAPRPYRFSK